MVRAIPTGGLAAMTLTPGFIIGPVIDLDMVVETVQMIVPTYRDNKEEKNENKQKIESIERCKHKKKNVSESYYD